MPASPAAKRNATKFSRWPCWSPSSRCWMKPIPAWISTPCALSRPVSTPCGLRRTAGHDRRQHPREQRRAAVFPVLGLQRGGDGVELGGLEARRLQACGHCGAEEGVPDSVPFGPEAGGGTGAHRGRDTYCGNASLSGVCAAQRARDLPGIAALVAAHGAGNLREVTGDTYYRVITEYKVLIAIDSGFPRV